MPPTSRFLLPALAALAALVFTLCCLAVTSAAADDFPELINTEKAEVKLTTPQEALRTISVEDGFHVTLFAAEPDVNQPIALATDDRGRLWVAENYTYAEHSTNFDERMRDRVIILEDSDNDGQFDKRTVFWDQGRRLTSVEIGHGGVWVLDAPNLLFIPDHDGDDVPDGDPVVMLDGWDDHAARHTIVNGLRWGPDGWLYGRNGIMATSRVGRPGATPDQRTPLNCAIWRFHPVRHKFEVVCAGTTNPWGMDWDENGQMFFINTVIGHLWHVVPGARYRRMYGEHFNPHTYGVIEQTADHFHWDTKENWHDIRKVGVTSTTDEAGGGHAHSGLTILQGHGFPDQYNGSVLAVNIHGQRVNRDVLHRHGATYTARHAPDFLKSGDPWFRGVEIISGRAGELFIADWSDVGECHENDGIHRTSGRIYRVAYSGSARSSRPQDPSPNQLSLDRLTELVVSPWEWLSRKCLLELGERTAAGKDMTAVHQKLLAGLHSKGTEQHRLRQLWALHVTGGTTSDVLHSLLDDRSEHMRSWAVRLLADGYGKSEEVARAFESRAKQDKSGLVLTTLASGLQRLRHQHRWPIAHALAARHKLAGDRVFPFMVWYGVEPAVLSHPDQAIKLAASSRLPLVREYIARRVTLEIERQPELLEGLLDSWQNHSEPTGGADDILRGMAEALRGWRKAPAVKNWETFSRRIEKDGTDEARQLNRELSLVFGDGRALDQLRAIANDRNADLSERRAAIRALVVARDAGMVKPLQELLKHRDLAGDAISGLAAYGHSETPQLLVSLFGRFSKSARQDAITTLVSRPQYAEALLGAIAGGRIRRSDVSAFQLRQMQSFGNDGISKQVADLWPELEQLSEAKVQRIAELRQQLTPARLSQADTSAGRALFNRSCANCHTLFGEGKKVAPDLTGAQRNNLNYLLENIVDPSATVSKNFKLSVIVQEDGRVINGVVVARTEKTLTVQTATDQIVVQRDEIEEMTESPVSLMPEKLLDVLTDEQTRDLIAYLMVPSQVPLPSEETGLAD